MSGRPLDVLEAAVGDDVEVRLKSGETYRGVLAGYDQHMNLVLEDVGTPPSERPTTTLGDSEDESEGDSEDKSEADADAAVDPDDGQESDDAEPAEPRDTTIIRGDNVVSITP